jgi:hypothetical protein
VTAGTAPGPNDDGRPSASRGATIDTQAKHRSAARGCLPLIVVAVGILVVAAIFAFPRITAPASARSGRAQPSGRVVVEVPPGQILPARQWPAACQFLSDTEVKAVLPDATELGTFPGGASTRTIEEFAADDAYHDEEYAPEGRCVWHLRLPGERINAFTFVSLGIIAVADPGLIARYHHAQILGRGGGVAADELPDGTSCYDTGIYDSHLVCARGPVMYELGGSTTTGFGEFRAYSYWRDTVLRELAITVSAKITTS